MTDDLDETIEESFPASDAPANTPETGIGVNGDHDTESVENADAPAPAAADERDQYSTKTSSGKQ
jgi:hypothetical protein